MDLNLLRKTFFPDERIEKTLRVFTQLIEIKQIQYKFLLFKSLP